MRGIKMVNEQNLKKRIGVITVPGGKGFNGYNFELNFLQPNQSFCLTREKINVLDRLGPEGWWRSYIPNIAKGKPVYLSHRQLYLDSLRAIGLTITEDLLR
jgi:hypothetical protein